MQHPALGRDFTLTVLSPESTVQQLLQSFYGKNCDLFVYLHHRMEQQL